MNKLLVSLAIAGLIAGPAGSAFAQAPQDQQQPQAQQQSEDQSSGEVGQPSIGELPGLIAGNAEAATRFDSMQSIAQSDITFIRLTPGAEFDAVIQENQSGIDSLRTNLQANTTLWQSIDEAYRADIGAGSALAAEDVVAAGVADDGSVIVYLR